MYHKRLSTPVFLMCSERSGSNLITRIFGAHPEFFAPSPAHLFRVFSQLAPGRDLSCEILRMFDAKLGIWKSDDFSPEERKALLAESGTTAEMIATLLNAEGALQQKSRLFLKENSAHSFLPFMEAVADEPGYVHMVRDPRDMAVSWVAAPTLRGGIVRAARRWLSDTEGALKAGQEGRQIVRLTYEALVSQPEETLRRVCSELGVAFSDVMLKHVGNSQGVAQDAARTALWGNLSREIMRDNFNKFKGKLSDDEIAYIEALCGPLMARFGYENSRAADAPPYGSHDSFDALEAALEAREPWEKSAYQKLPQDERDRLEHWSTLRQELVDQHGTS
ncbi:sulfotransferase [Roseovarius sp. CAU 1744]|uniref:sulfotransferase n=1 Tax=Roseovarius sp. CAU 1744 TaxID=3140368 RepID=UPI00325A90EF